MTTTVQIDLEPGAERAFIGYLAGSVVEVAVVRDASTETIVGMIDTVAPHDYGSPALLVRRFDEERGRPVGEQFVVGLADIKRITVF